MQGVETKCLNNRFVTVSRTASNPAFAKNISDPAEPTPMLTMPVGASVLAPVNNIHSIVTQIALNGIHPAKRRWNKRTKQHQLTSRSQKKRSLGILYSTERQERGDHIRFES
jgi:hypothetical protein